KDPFQDSAVDDRNAHAANVTKLTIRPNDAFLNVTAQTLRRHTLYGARHERAVLRMDEPQILLKCGGSLLRIEAINLEQFARPVFKETGRIKRPASDVSESLPLGEVELAPSYLLNSQLLLGNIQTSSNKSSDNSVFEDWSTEIAYHSELTIGPHVPILLVEDLTVLE